MSLLSPPTLLLAGAAHAAVQTKRLAALPESQNKLAELRQQLDQMLRVTVGSSAAAGKSGANQ